MQTLPCSDSNRKSKSVEETFAEISNPQNLISKCEELCEELHQQIQEEGISVSIICTSILTFLVVCAPTK